MRLPNILARILPVCSVFAPAGTLAHVGARRAEAHGLRGGAALALQPLEFELVYHGPEPAGVSIQKGTRVLISLLWDSLMFGRVLEYSAGWQCGEQCGVTGRARRAPR